MRLIPKAKPIQSHEKRIFGLDLMRAVAILLVVIHHGFNVLSFPFIPLPDGVDIFFVLSGFLIGRIIIKCIERKGCFLIQDLKLFLLRRWFRTLPALWFTLMINLAITFALTLQSHSVRETIKQMFLKDRLWEYFLFLQNLSHGLSTGFFSESWSLSVEEWFYLLMPGCIFILLQFKIKTRKAVLASILIMIVAPGFARYFYSDIHGKGTWLVIRMVVIMRLDSIGFGVLLAYTNCYKNDLWNWLASSRTLLISGTFFFYLSCLILKHGFIFLVSVNQTNFIFYPLTGFFIMTALPALSRQKGGNGLNRIVTFISKISYSMYLINFSIIVQLIRVCSVNKTSQTEKVMLYLLYWFLTISLSACMYRFVEQPFMKMRDKYFAEH
jgi:peptidoglycan/LPS O-acetylase OafA/YrhL